MISFEIDGIRHNFQQSFLKIGSTPTSQLRLDSMKGVSRMHAVFEVEDVAQGLGSVIDLGAEKGTRLNGQKISKSVVKVGDVLTFGLVDVKVVAIGQITTTPIAPVPLASQLLSAPKPKPDFSEVDAAVTVEEIVKMTTADLIASAALLAVGRSVYQADYPTGVVGLAAFDRQTQIVNDEINKRLPGPIAAAALSDVESAADQIRLLLLDFSCAERREVLDHTDICTHCFDNLRMVDGNRAKCFCQSEE